MRSRSASSRVLFFVVLAAIAAVFLIGRFWLERGSRTATTEAGMVGRPAETVPAK